QTYLPLVIPQMRAIGVDSVPLAIMVAAFIGGVISIQIRYQMFQGIQLSIVGLSVRQIVILETGPLLTGLVLAGRVGAKMTAEIGTMRVTEQIDALETLAYDPIAYLVVPRVIAGTVMFPVIVAAAMITGIGCGWIASATLLDLSSAQFVKGLRLYFQTFDVGYGLVESASFGLAVTLVGARRG